jgi:hypothetical protein
MLVNSLHLENICLFLLLYAISCKFSIINYCHLVFSFVSGKAVIVGIKSDSVAAEDVSVNYAQIFSFSFKSM